VEHPPLAGSNFNPRNTQCIPVVKIFAFSFVLTTLFTVIGAGPQDGKFSRATLQFPEKL